MERWVMPRFLAARGTLGLLAISMKARFALRSAPLRSTSLLFVIVSFEAGIELFDGCHSAVAMGVLKFLRIGGQVEMR
ncbi:hypothetical protein [Bradyrhizobium sp. CCBAU 51753]|uniref:hypothetical protein n=1 Tax=Bradyrhizobium sp. CCBAU 51753 TaxID=1325100 RepID=UPI00188D6564|nr:hypothetical protein [Bradyrhizobium sp. CCBAU 51753]QOZ23971.1 hypothetical protein XH93_10480 [Bradyrhizobium sp. CCBAU 51753]